MNVALTLIIKLLMLLYADAIIADVFTVKAFIQKELIFVPFASGQDRIRQYFHGCLNYFVNAVHNDATKVI